MNLFKRVFNKVRDEGLIHTFQSAITNSYDRYYDYKYKVDTFSWVSKEDFNVEASVNAHAVEYQATRALPLRKLFKLLKVPKGKVLVDLGSGKGRILLVGSEFGFKEVIGVEFSPLLCEIARKNISTYKEKNSTNTKFSIVQIDASKYMFNDNEDVFFLYNPFDEYILKKVLHNISESIKRNKRTILIIYAYPVNRHLIESEMEIVDVKNFIIWGGDFVVYEI